jgi:hypothetical protein
MTLPFSAAISSCSIADSATNSCHGRKFSAGDRRHSYTRSKPWIACAMRNSNSLIVRTKAVLTSTVPTRAGCHAVLDRVLDEYEPQPGGLGYVAVMLK